VVLGETNTLPYGVRVVAPATVAAHRKIGGTLVAGLPAGSGPAVLATASAVWSWVSAAENVWETLLVNYNAIDHVPPLICNLGTVESRAGRMLLWGEGATPAVVNVIEAVDEELLALRAALGLATDKRYVDYLVDQGVVREAQSSLHATIHASRLAAGQFACGPRALENRYMTEDVPYSLVLMSSIGDELGVGTPVIDGLVAIASAATRTDWRRSGRTLAAWGLAGGGRQGLIDAAVEDWF
jgi:opine dehydrogenase